jgi:HAE1 family hydrophobic/amphiphilic exporter-1
MALSNAAGAEFRAPMAWIVIGGLATSTALTLVVVPVFYALADDATEWVKRVVRRLRGAGGREPAKVAR